MAVSCLHVHLPLFLFRPAPTIAWSRPRSNLPSGPRSSISHFGTTLNISNIVDSDGGDYVCTATNANGTANHVHNIRVEGMSVPSSVFLMIIGLSSILGGKPK